MPDRRPGGEVRRQVSGSPSSSTPMTCHTVVIATAALLVVQSIAAASMFLALRGGGTTVDQWVPVGVCLAAGWFVLGAAGGFGSAPPRCWPGWYAISGAIGLALVSAASGLWTASVSLTLDAFAGWLAAALMLGLVAWSCRGARLAMTALIAVVLVSVVAASVVTFELFTGGLELYRYGRLAYPIRYANGAAALILVGLPAAVGLAAGTRHRVGLRGLLTGVAGVLLAAGSLSLSRGSVLALAAAAVVLVVASRSRRGAVLTIIVLGLALSAASPLLFESDDTSSGIRGFGIVLTATLAALGGSGLAFIEPALADALRGKGGRALAAAASVVAIAGTTVGVVARAGTPWDATARAWDEFRSVQQAPVTDETASRFESAQSNRYDYWRVSYGAWREHPLLGVGGGAFPISWYRERRSLESVTDPHGWPFKLASELGLVGLAFFGFVVASLAAAAAICRRRGGLSAIIGAAAAGSTTYFLVHGAVDWIFSIVAILLLGQLAAGSLLGAAAGSPPRLATGLARVVPALLPLAAVVVFLPFWISTTYVARAEASIDPREALGNAQAAAHWNPLALTPLQLEAEIRAGAGDLEGAEAVLRKALRSEPSRWELWSQIAWVHSLRGEEADAVRARRIAKRLNPFRPS